MEASAAGPLSAAVRVLLQGQHSAMKLRELLVAGADQLKPTFDAPVDDPRPPSTAEDLVGDVFRSFTSVLSILNRGDSDESSQSQLQQVPPPSPAFGGCNPTKSEESSRESCQTHSSIRKDRRGCYKRSRGSDSCKILSSNYGDDGYQWRKYGQKSILNTNFPRSYYRCTHKVDQGCQATKQVQQVSSDPPMYQSIYHGKHTCQNYLKSPPIILPDDDSIPGNSVILSFNTDKSGDSINARGDNNISKKNTFSLPLSDVKLEINEVTAATNCTGASNNQSSTSSEYGNFPSSEFAIFNSTDHGEALSSSNSFTREMELTMGDVDFSMFDDCHFPGS